MSYLGKSKMLAKLNSYDLRLNMSRTCHPLLCQLITSNRNFSKVRDHNALMHQEVALVKLQRIATSGTMINSTLICWIAH